MCRFPAQLRANTVKLRVRFIALPPHREDPDHGSGRASGAPISQQLWARVCYRPVAANGCAVALALSLR